MKIWSGTSDSYKELAQKVAETKQGIDLSYFVKQREPAVMDENGIATISVFGPLMDNEAPVYEDLGCTDYRAVLADIQAAKNAGAKGILLKVDSPGGMVQGCIEAAEAIANLDIPCVAYCDGMACSAAYKLSAGASWIVSRESATVGNIGTIMVWADDSEFWNSMGVQFNAITNEGADYKSTFHVMPLTEEQEAFLQAELNEMGETFKAHVEANRDVDPEVFKAGWYSGEKAKALGLIDEVGSEDLAKLRLAELTQLDNLQ